MKKWNVRGPTGKYVTAIKGPIPGDSPEAEHLRNVSERLSVCLHWFDFMSGLTIDQRAALGEWRTATKRFIDAVDQELAQPTSNGKA